MTELTSQAYTGTLRRRRPISSSVRPGCGCASSIRDALEEAAAGADGLLAVLDLGNVGSVLHLLTEDLGAAEDGGFRLLGRASGAELRGCSLTAEELEAEIDGPAGRR